MLPYIIAIALGLSSLTLFGLAFFSPDIHRQDDFLWSGVGLFYALVLWTCAGRMTGAVLLGQTAAAILIVAFGWQTLQLRRSLLYPAEVQTQNLGFSVLNWLAQLFGPVISLRSPAASENRVPKTPAPATPAPTAEVEPEEFEEDVTPTAETKLELEMEAANPSQITASIDELEEETLPTESLPSPDSTSAIDEPPPHA